MKKLQIKWRNKRKKTRTIILRPTRAIRAFSENKTKSQLELERIKKESMRIEDERRQLLELQRQIEE